MFPSYQPAGLAYPSFPASTTRPKYKRTWKKASLEALCQRCQAYSLTWSKPMQSFSMVDFAWIASGLEQTPEQCFVKCRELLVSGTLKAGVWCKTEEELLADLVQTTTLKWGEIARVLNEAIHEGVAVRTGKKCKEQWNNHLNPQVNKGAWLPHEDLAILLGHAKYGNRWSLIAKELEGRMESSVKNRIKSLLNKAQQRVKQSSDAHSLLEVAIAHAQEEASK